MTTVTIAPAVVNVCDIVEYAHALIEEHGWRQGARVPDTEEWDKVAANGLSLHDAIGMACWRLSGEVGTQAAPPRQAAHSKDFPVPSKGKQFGYGGSLRTATTDAVTKYLPSGQTDIAFNDKAKDKAEVLAVLDKVIKEVCNGGSVRS